MPTHRQGNANIQVQKQEQRQTTSAQQVLAAQLTELTVEELRARIETECDENPWLETRSPDSGNDHDEEGEWNDNGEDGADGIDTYPGNEEPERDDDFPQPQQNGDYNGPGMENGEELTFHDMLMNQMLEYELTEKQQRIMEYLIGSLDKDGLLRLPLEQIADELDIYHGLRTNEREVAEVLDVLQQFDPWGVGARNLCECLLIQVRHNESLPMRSQLIRLLTDYSNELTMGHWKEIEQRMKLTPAEVAAMRNAIKRLNPRPGGSVGATPTESNHRIVPDFTVSIDEDGEPRFVLNEGNLPMVTLADDYSAEDALMLAETTSEKVRQEVVAAQRFQKARMDEGRMFIEALAARRHSMTLTMGAILRLQKKFFREGDENMLQPMKLEDIATLTRLDVSTISRVCRSKSVDTPYGVLPLSWFFSSKVMKDGEQQSSRSVTLLLKEIIAGEDKRKPYSDEALARMLQEKGYDVARRTVAKYRIQMGIPDSRLRR